MLNRKSKMVSFRLSNEEYQLYRSVCDAHGFDNISDLVRQAVLQLTHLTNGKPKPNPTFEDQLKEVRIRLTHLEDEVGRLAAHEVLKG